MLKERIKYKKHIICALFLSFSLILNSCNFWQPSEEIIAPVSDPTVQTQTPTPTPEKKPTQQTPPPAALKSLYTKDFFSTDLAYTQYNIFKNEGAEISTQDSYVEYINESANKIQRHLISKQHNPYIQVLYYIDGAIFCFEKNNTPYTYNFLDYNKNATKWDILLKDPIIVGSFWDVTNGTSTITSIDKFVSVPLGNFDVVEVKTDYKNGETKLSYYAQNYGLVSEHIFNKDSKLVSSREIVTREKDVALKQPTKIFFTDPKTNKIKYVYQTLSITPNTKMEKVFATKLKSPPSSDLLSLGSNVSINSIRLNRNNSVTVDFSLHLVTQNRIFSQNEVAFLQSLADTIGVYYHSKNVFITINQEPYASNNIFLRDDESFSPKPGGALEYKTK